MSRPVAKQSRDFSVWQALNRILQHDVRGQGPERGGLLFARASQMSRVGAWRCWSAGGRRAR